jgi:hypothetical protein
MKCLLKYLMKKKITGDRVEVEFWLGAFFGIPPNFRPTMANVHFHLNMHLCDNCQRYI